MDRTEYPGFFLAVMQLLKYTAFESRSLLYRGAPTRNRTRTPNVRTVVRYPLRHRGKIFNCRVEMKGVEPLSDD